MKTLSEILKELERGYISADNAEMNIIELYEVSITKRTAKEILNECFLGVIDFNEEAALHAMQLYLKENLTTKTRTQIEERLKIFEERKSVFEEVYAELKTNLPDSPNQFDNPEYKKVLGQIVELRWVLSK